MLARNTECAVAKGQRRHVQNRNYVECAASREGYSEVSANVLCFRVHPNNLW